MCDVPFIPFFPICFQCGTDQNPCHCKDSAARSLLLYVPAPVQIDMHFWNILTSPGCLLAGFDLLWMWMYSDRTRVWFFPLVLVTDRC
ncbi:hypothetical protein N7478_003194 [Penicillium angulare]|uniref:uncharacterized protein n=1 Tax=Penicillium angulare TaxID=116970 RepID=UPI002540F199|nr:uncharacterized protein N7478_003194 [Penicillium angulare]KAJ5287508.1 hypothetical protein N7478_003194 [Penicillium angulare]